MSRRHHLDRRNRLTGRRAESAASRADGAIDVDIVNINPTSRTHALRKLGSGVVVDLDAEPHAAQSRSSLRSVLILLGLLVPADPDGDSEPPWGRP